LLFVVPAPSAGGVPIEVFIFWVWV
jgi:hypothetical protein